MELCPLLKEFKAITGSQLNFACQIMVPSIEIPDLHSIQYQIARMFNFLSQSSLRHIFGTEVLISSLVEVTVAVDNKEIY